MQKLKFFLTSGVLAVLLMGNLGMATNQESSTFTLEVNVDGLEGTDTAELRLLAGTPRTASDLSEGEITLPTLSVCNGSHILNIADVSDGSYKLMMYAPSDYFREPQGYLFQVSGGQIIRKSESFFQFKLVPLSDQDWPPCRNLTTRPDSSASSLIAEDISLEPRVVCRAERLIDVSSPPKQPERYEQDIGILDVGYHYAGPETSQDNQGVWGRNYVVDPSVRHSPGPTQFVVERVYANDSSYDNWMEAGWAEHSSRDDGQYIYEYDSVTQEWHYFDEYDLSPGLTVETLVEYRPDTDTWWALYYLGDNDWAILAEESLGFTTADRGYNRGEVYTADGTHPILPVSGFDKGYLRIDDVWRVWDTRYSTRVDEDAPYECDIIDQYYRFNVHSPVVFLPLVVKNW